MLAEDQKEPVVDATTKEQEQVQPTQPEKEGTVKVNLFDIVTKQATQIEAIVKRLEEIDAAKNAGQISKEKKPLKW